MKRFLAVFFARNLEFFRDKSTFFWNIFFPVFLIFGFAFAFSGQNNSAYKVGTIGTADTAMEFMKTRYVQFVPYETLEGALKKLAHHQIDMILDFKSTNYYVSQESDKSYLIEKIFLSGKNSSASGPTLERKTITGQEIRYIDWFVPGVLGMNIMFGCLFGVGYVIVRYRQNSVLKRFKATPLHAFEFITAQLFSRFFIVMFMSVIIFTGTNFFLHFRMNGSYLDLILVTSLAVLCMISLGLLFSVRSKSEELVGGLMNIVLWPMMMMSGIWFSLEGTPKILQDASAIFPITHFVDASRKIMLDGATLTGVIGNLIPLAGMTLGFLVLSALFFKWE